MRNRYWHPVTVHRPTENEAINRASRRSIGAVRSGAEPRPPTLTTDETGCILRKLTAYEEVKLMASAKMRIRAACKSMYEAYAEYSANVLHIPVTTKAPHVDWYPGRTEAGSPGTWVVDNRSYPGTADQVVAHFQERETYWMEKSRRKSEPAAKDAK